jgi:hypothetical protein
MQTVHEAYNIETSSSSDGNGFIIDGGCTDSVIEYCYAHNNEGSGFQLTQYANAGAQFYGNIVRYSIAVNNKVGIGAYGEVGSWAMADTQVYGNTVFADRSQQRVKMLGQIYLLTAFRNFSCYNNLVMTRQTDIPLVESWMSTPASTVAMAGNAYYSYGTTASLLFQGKNLTSLAAWRTATGWEVFANSNTGVMANPLLQSLPSDAIMGLQSIDSFEQRLSGWRLQAASPAVNVGIDLRAAGIKPPSVDLCNNNLPSNTLYDAGACKHM